MKLKVQEACLIDGIPYEIDDVLDVPGDIDARTAQQLIWMERVAPMPDQVVLPDPVRSAAKTDKVA